MKRFIIVLETEHAFKSLVIWARSAEEALRETLDSSVICLHSISE